MQAFTEKGEYIAQFGDEGSEEGQFNFGYTRLGLRPTQGESLDHGLQQRSGAALGSLQYIPANEEATVEDTPEVEVNESQAALSPASKAKRRANSTTNTTASS